MLSSMSVLCSSHFNIVPTCGKIPFQYTMKIQIKFQLRKLEKQCVEKSYSNIQCVALNLRTVLSFISIYMYVQSISIPVMSLVVMYVPDPKQKQSPNMFVSGMSALMSQMYMILSFCATSIPMLRYTNMR